jgi:hypothetical protein
MRTNWRHFQRLFVGVGVGLLTAIEPNAAESPHSLRHKLWLNRETLITDLGADTCLQCELQTFGGGVGYEDPLIPRADNDLAGTKFLDFNSMKLNTCRRIDRPIFIQHFYTEINVNS